MNLTQYKDAIGRGALRRLAERCQISEGYVSHLTTGHKRLTYDLAVRLAAVDSRLNVVQMIEHNRQLHDARHPRQREGQAA